MVDVSMTGVRLSIRSLFEQKQWRSEERKMFCNEKEARLGSMKGKCTQRRGSSFKGRGSDARQLTASQSSGQLIETMDFSHYS